MAVRFGYFDSSNSDRTYDAATFTLPFKMMLNTGFFKTDIGSFYIKSNSNMTIEVQPGAAWVDGHWVVNDTNLTLTVPPAHALYPRLDRVVVYVDRSSRMGGIRIVEGTPATSPTLPSLSKGTRFELEIGYIRVAQSGTSVPQNSIWNRVGQTADSPWVTGPNGTFNVGAVTERLQSDFTAWFNTIKGQMSGDVAASLTQRMNGLEDALGIDQQAIADIKSEVADYLTWGRAAIDPTYQTGIDKTGYNQLRVVAGKLYYSGFFRFNDAKILPTGTTNNYRIIAFPTAVTQDLRAHGWGNDYFAVGSFVCPGNNINGILMANDNGLYLGYRTGNPTAGSWINAYCMGAQNFNWGP